MTKAHFLHPFGLEQRNHLPHPLIRPFSFLVFYMNGQKTRNHHTVDNEITLAKSVLGMGLIVASIAVDKIFPTVSSTIFDNAIYRHYLGCGN